MPRTRSAKKALRQSRRRQLRNLAKKLEIRKVKKQFRKALALKNIEASREAFRKLQKLLDKAAKTGTIHKNTAARLKSRLAKALAKALATA
jgi:small subunit ribosomal protein S20